MKRRLLSRLVTLALLCAGPALGQAPPDLRAGLLIDWRPGAASEAGIFDRLRDGIDKITDMIVRATSPDSPPEKRRLWTIRVDGTGRTLLSDQTGVRRPRWGSQGYIAAEVEADSNGDRAIDLRDDIQLYLVKADGTGGRLLGPGRSPVWSPDGRQVAFLRNGRIWVHTLGGETAVMDSTSLTGQLILTNRRSAATASEFWALDLAQGTYQKLPEDLKGRYLWLGSVSPSGAQLVFHDTMRSDIHIRSLAASPAERQEKNLTADSFSDMEPAWAPDETSIVYVSDKPLG